MTDIDTTEIRRNGTLPQFRVVLALCDALDAERARAEKAENQARHWQEQEAKQRRLHHEQGDWKHRALAAEGNLASARNRATKAEATLTRIAGICDAQGPDGYTS